MQSASPTTRRRHARVERDPNAEPRPTVKQVYKMARTFAEIANVPWPETQQECSTLIDLLVSQLPAVDAVAAGEVAPF